jgi:hypothetical protein
LKIVQRPDRREARKDGHIDCWESISKHPAYIPLNPSSSTNWIDPSFTEATWQSEWIGPQFAWAPPREEVNNLIMATVSHDLPRMEQAPIHQVGQQLTNAVGNFTATFVDENEADRLEGSQSSQAKVMTLEKKYTYQAEPLKRLLQIAALADAPAVWHVIAANNTKQVRQILQTALTQTRYQMHLKPPVLHQALTQHRRSVGHKTHCVGGPRTSCPTLGAIRNDTVGKVSCKMRLLSDFLSATLVVGLDNIFILSVESRRFGFVQFGHEFKLSEDGSGD